MGDPTQARDFDVIIVGGGPAGSATGGLLALRGHRVLLLERDEFPRYHIGESLITGMMDVLGVLGLHERLEAMDFPRKYGLSIVWGKDRSLWNINFGELGGPYSYSYHVRRAEFDKLLLDRAAELGVTVRESVTVKEPIVEQDRVVGVRFQSGRGLEEQRAPIVVDASGQSRTLSRRLTTVNWSEDLRQIAHWTYFENGTDLPEGQEGNILIERADEGWFWGIPVDGHGKLSVGYVTAAASGTGDTYDELFHDELRRTKHLRSMLTHAHQVDQFRTARDWSYTAADYAGAGWLAVGDAASFIDPLFSGGVCMAILGADRAAKAVDVALRRQDLESRALAGYARGFDTMVAAFLAYVRFFYDPNREREDYFERAKSIAAYQEQNQDGQVAFVAVVSGAAAMATLFDIPEIEEPVPATSAPES